MAEVEAVIAKVANKFPFVQVEIIRGISQDLVKQLEIDAIDIVVHVFCSDEPPQATAILLRSLVWVSCCSPDSDFADIPVVPSDELAKRRQICCAGMLSNPLTKVGGKVAFEIWQCTDQEDAARLIEEDLGWGFLPEAVFHERKALGALTQFDYESNSGKVSVTTRLELLHPSNRLLSEAQQMFVDLMVMQK